jgi:hypothetical protein
MNYAAHYERLISRARGRTITGYRERHHVLPRCMGGTDDPQNIVELTGEEHYVAHQLLVKMYPGNRRLTHAANLMSRASGNKSYGWIRRLHAKAISEALRGKERPEQRGRVFTAEHRVKLSAARKKRIYTPELRANLSASLKGKMRSEQHRTNHAEALRGFKHSEEMRAKVSASLIGNTRAAGCTHWIGRKHSEEAKAKISAAKKGIPPSPEAIAKIAAKNTGRKYGPMSAERRANISAAKTGKPWTEEQRAIHMAARSAKRALRQAHG